MPRCSAADALQDSGAPYRIEQKSCRPPPGAALLNSRSVVIIFPRRNRPMPMFGTNWPIPGQLSRSPNLCRFLCQRWATLVELCTLLWATSAHGHNLALLLADFGRIWATSLAESGPNWSSSCQLCSDEAKFGPMAEFGLNLIEFGPHFVEPGPNLGRH